VLVVDDNVDAADMLALLVSSWGHRSAVAYDGPAGLEAVAAFRPDAVLMDIGLPGMDGWELASRLRRLPGREDLLLVAITSYGDDRARGRSREAGIDQHLVKPVDPDTLLPLLASRAGRCEAAR
jgi:two-component system CheB/CheR fusion protein